VKRKILAIGLLMATALLSVIVLKSKWGIHTLHANGERASAHVLSDEKIESKIEINTFITASGQYGYDILLDGRKFIHQPHLPGIRGTQGFTSEQDARKVAQFVAKKILNHIIPPTISRAELDSLLSR
jgi:hypothetical protein